ncbi:MULTISPECIES: hypothetical protein [Actinomycetes]|nr:MULTISPECIES: hypothetical protein [Actinomycetes]
MKPPSGTRMGASSSHRRQPHGVTDSHFPTVARECDTRYDLKTMRLGQT